MIWYIGEDGGATQAYTTTVPYTAPEEEEVDDDATDDYSKTVPYEAGEAVVTILYNIVAQDNTIAVQYNTLVQDKSLVRLGK